MKTEIRKLIIIASWALLILLFAVYFYTLLHEGGHALVAIMYGGKLKSFVLGFNAHMSYSGANFTHTGELLFHSAGFLLPFTTLFIVLLFYNRQVKNNVYHFVHVIFTIMIAGSSIAWIAIPALSMFITPPAGDDVTKFLKASALNPLLVSLVALLLVSLLAFIACRKGLHIKAKEVLNIYSQSAERKRQPAAFLPLILIFIWATSIFFQVLPQGKVFSTSFTTSVAENKKVMEMSFEVKKAKSYSMDLALEAEGMLTDVQIYDDKGNTVYQNICEWVTLSTSLDLKEGNYLLVLTFIRDPEVMEQHFAEKGYTFTREQEDMLQEVFTRKVDTQFTPVSFSALIR